MTYVSPMADKSSEPVRPRVWLSTQQAAEYLGVSAKTLEYWRQTGNSPPFSKLGRKVRYRQDLLDKWLEERSATSTAECRQRRLI